MYDSLCVLQIDLFSLHFLIQFHAFNATQEKAGKAYIYSSSKFRESQRADPDKFEDC